MADLLARRGFLRSLAHLPLIGGGVTLVGNSTAAAVPITTAMLTQYETWLHFERELRPGLAPGSLATFCGAADKWHRDDSGKPSDQAAVVLSAVGCGWRED